jgi:hypothetical protein
MRLSRIQQIGIAFFICTWPPSYLIANWRYDASVATLEEALAQEKSLHTSTDKLLLNCERDEAHDNDHYSSNHQICAQGLQEHELTSHAMDTLVEDQARNERRWYRNFFLSLALFNLLGLAVFKIRQFSQRNDN